MTVELMNDREEQLYAELQIDLGMVGKSLGVTDGEVLRVLLALAASQAEGMMRE